MTEATVHLVAGATGAGKTTYARALSDRLGAVRFSIDEWMTALFWPDAPDPIDGGWALARVERCYTQIWATARAVLERDVPVVLDLGFTTRATRDRFAELAQRCGRSAQLHFVDVPQDERWRRVQVRNADPANDQLRFAITRTMFDYVEGMWEPPGDEEMRRLSGMRIG